MIQINRDNEKFFDTAKQVYALRDAGRAYEATQLVNELSAASVSAEISAENRLWLGFCQSQLGLFEHAQASLDLAWSGLPPETFLSYRAGWELANVRYCLGRFDEAVRLESMLQGSGWYECFLDGWVGGSLEFRTLLRRFRQMWLMDQPVVGKRILLFHGGGLGDFVQYSRYIEKLKAEGAVYIDVALMPSALTELVLNSRLQMNPIRFYPENLGRYDYFTYGHSLFLRYQRSREDLPQRPGYLGWRGRTGHRPLPGPVAARKIGITWRSQEASCRHEPFRSMELVTIEKLLGIESIQFYALQFGELTVAEKSLLARHQARVIDMSQHIRSLSDTAEIIAQLDLVISIDSAPAHLAGALGVPVWVMLAKAADWRWGASHEQMTPWYRSMQLFRQTTLGDWAPVIDRIFLALSS